MRYRRSLTFNYEGLGCRVVEIRRRGCPDYRIQGWKGWPVLVIQGVDSDGEVWTTIISGDKWSGPDELWELALASLCPAVVRELSSPIHHGYLTEEYRRYAREGVK